MLVDEIKLGFSNRNKFLSVKKKFIYRNKQPEYVLLTSVVSSLVHCSYS